MVFLARWTDFTRKSTAEITCTTCDIEHFHTGTHVGTRHRKRLPGTVQARRHEIIHDIVTISHRMEHLGHVRSFF